MNTFHLVSDEIRKNCIDFMSSVSNNNVATIKEDMQGVINGKITQLSSNPSELAEFMTGKTDEQKRHGRIHLKMVLMLKDKK